MATRRAAAATPGAPSDPSIASAQRLADPTDTRHRAVSARRLDRHRRALDRRSLCRECLRPAGRASRTSPARGGVIGVRGSPRKSAPDGYTILVAPDFVTSAPHIFKMNIDPMKDAGAGHPAVAPAGRARRCILRSAWQRSREFIALAKRQPGMGYATSGVGSQQQMVAAWFAKLAGIKLRARALSRRRTGDQRSHRRPYRWPRSARRRSFRITRPGTCELLGAEHGGALAEPARCADLSGGRHQDRARPVARRAAADRHAAGDRRPAERPR